MMSYLSICDYYIDSHVIVSHGRHDLMTRKAAFTDDCYKCIIITLLNVGLHATVNVIESRETILEKGPLACNDLHWKYLAFAAQGTASAEK